MTISLWFRGWTLRLPEVEGGLYGIAQRNRLFANRLSLSLGPFWWRLRTVYHLHLRTWGSKSYGNMRLKEAISLGMETRHQPKGLPILLISIVDSVRGVMWPVPINKYIRHTNQIVPAFYRYLKDDQATALLDETLVLSAISRIHASVASAWWNQCRTLLTETI